MARDRAQRRKPKSGGVGLWRKAAPRRGVPPWPVCPYCHEYVEESQEEVRKGLKTYHVDCLKLHEARVVKMREEAAERLSRSSEERQRLIDEQARESMRSHKPSTWKLGRSASSFGKG